MAAKGECRLKQWFVIILLIFTTLVAACNAIRVPKSSMDHQMSAMPTDVTPTISKWKIPDHPTAKMEIPIAIRIKDQSNKLIQSFDTVHEKKMHLFIVSKDLSYFSHLHPKYKGNGEFDFTASFPTGGDYKMISEFTPAGAGDNSVETHWVHIDGPVSNAVPIEPDRSLTKEVDGKKVTLSINNLITGKTLHMTFSIRDAKTDKPIKNLQPYLGAMGHAVAISADTKNYLHIHPMATEGTGPEVTFMTIFPEKGVYKIWGQFKQEDKVFVIPFIVKVP